MDHSTKLSAAVSAAIGRVGPVAASATSMALHDIAMLLRVTGAEAANVKLAKVCAEFIVGHYGAEHAGPSIEHVRALDGGTGPRATTRPPAIASAVSITRGLAAVHAAAEDE